MSATARLDEDDHFAARDRCAITGIGTTEFSRNSGRSALTLATEAALAAIADAGLKLEDVDGLVRCDMDTTTPWNLATSLGLPNLRYWGDSGPGGTGPCMMVGLAVAAVLSGQARHVVVYRSLNGRSEARFGAGAPTNRDGVGGFGTYDEFFLPYGLLTPGQTFALMTRQQMDDHGLTAEQLGAVAIACRKAANHSPTAQMHGKPMTMEDYLASRMISSPLRLFDFCLESDGAAAIVVSAAERARDMPHPPILIRAVAGGIASDPRAGTMFSVTARDMTDIGGRNAAADLWRRAGVGPSEVDTAQLYDCFTISVILQLEAFGFCKRGEGGEFAASGALEREGSLPINTAGGHLSGGYIHGMNHIVEAVRQLRGTADMQIADADVALCTGGLLPFGTSILLRRDQ